MKNNLSIPLTDAKKYTANGAVLLAFLIRYNKSCLCGYSNQQLSEGLGIPLLEIDDLLKSLHEQKLIKIYYQTGESELTLNDTYDSDECDRYIGVHNIPIDEIPKTVFEKLLFGEELLPEEHHINEYIDLSGSRVKSLPDNLRITKTLNLNWCTDFQKLPEKLYVGKNLYLRQTPISYLPESLVVLGNIYFDKEQEGRIEVPEHLNGMVVYD